MGSPLLVGDVARIDLNLDNDGEPIDPTSLTIVVQSPSQKLTATSTTYTFPSAQLLQRLDALDGVTPLVGRYRALIECSESGIWAFRWSSPGPDAKAAAEGRFTVSARSF